MVKIIVKIKSQGGRVMDVDNFIEKIKSISEEDEIILQFDSVPSIGETKQQLNKQ